MKQDKTKQSILKCGLGITNNARKGIAKVIEDELAFFSMQEAFDIYIEKRKSNREGAMAFTLFFDNDTNELLAKRLDGKVAVMECVYQSDGFLATGFHVRGRKEIVRTNRRLPIRIKFLPGRKTAAPIELYTQLRELPIAEERSEYVKKRIASWEGYLRIQERNADVEDVTTTFSKVTFNEDFTRLRLVCGGLKAKGWQMIQGFSAKLKGSSRDIGQVLKTNKAKSTVEIELNRFTAESARKNHWRPKWDEEIIFSNFAELSQVRRLRKGFKDLQDGLAANPNLEKILFEERPRVRITNQKKKLEFHNELNEFQQEAVAGAMNANDLYVIQGPPGTGKTTVISEICYQNVKAGLKTLVASQANLAVDNALGRLLSDSDIRILRYGRTESIEEEGKKFIEENVAHYWKEQTVEAVDEQLQSFSLREKETEEELHRCETQIKELQREAEELEKTIQLQQKAQEKRLRIDVDLKGLTKEIKQLGVKKQALENDQAKLKQTTVELQKVISRLKQSLDAEQVGEETEAQMKEAAKEIEILRGNMRYRQTLEEIGALIQALQDHQQSLELNQSKVKNLQDMTQQLQEIPRFSTFMERIRDFKIPPSSNVQKNINELQLRIREIHANTSSESFQDWNDLNNRLAIAIEKVEETLRQNGFRQQPIQRRMNQTFTSVQDIHGLVDRVGRFLISPPTKRMLETRNYSPEKYDCLLKIADAADILRERLYYAKEKAMKLERQDQLQQHAKELFAAIKSGINDQLNGMMTNLEHERKAVQQEMENAEIKLSDLRRASAKQLKQLGTVNESAAISFMEEALRRKEAVFAQFEEKKRALEQSARQLATHQEEVNEKANEEKLIAEELNELKEKQKTICDEMEERENERKVLDELLAQRPEEQRKLVIAEINTLHNKIEALESVRKRLPMTKVLQQQWQSLLLEANDYDLDEIRKLYVEHANVIGTTCVASARRDFDEEYPEFDVVIIDEVSKATPPELLLPMLKGKKIILVGDHHQLPPLIGQETMEEFLEEIENQEEQKEFAQLLNESLFERLFRTLPKQNKTMLGIQYRMHETIMGTIAPFYEEGNSRLQCGLTDSDRMRDHLLESRFVQRKDHLLWFDLPNAPNYFEERVKGGTSRFNQAELSMIEKLLADLNDATKNAKIAGRMAEEDQKSVGVISFYGEQVKRIDQLIEQKLMPQHLHCRTGSVDKFQGMEMDVIIVSFVRNHDEKGGDIGFAKDYRRLNVALSRARELLIVVGSSEMFTIQTKHPASRKMYGRLLQNVQEVNGLRDYQGDVIGEGSGVNG
ncbi:AAA domain-containing protein [Sporosarcina sp. HYO08]|uniref:AAA domain-containing protein n=1 Tax=Sporosarcina sp. HYO08 TaxID=1759557 RepID=UPI00079B0C3C|nr:AAA domain-containing protein [Sporosarcina sp. HYO08]KXH81950.1 hypothetical protein AU377_06740 [Sporosarcina sp. HYO08]